MEVVDEPQAGPFVLTTVLTFFMMAATYALIYFAQLSTHSADNVYWYITRAAAFTAYELLTLTVLLGVSTSSAVWDRWRARKLMTQMHQFVSLMVLPFLLLHVWALHMDTTIPFPWQQVVLPFQASYRPFATGLGILSMYGVMILWITSLLRTHIGVRTWRILHYLSFPLYLGVTLHGLLSGTDAAAPWARWLYFLPLVFVALLTIRRIQRATPGTARTNVQRNRQQRG